MDPDPQQVLLSMEALLPREVQHAIHGMAFRQEQAQLANARRPLPNWIADAAPQAPTAVPRFSAPAHSLCFDLPDGAAVIMPTNPALGHMMLVTQTVDGTDEAPTFMLSMHHDMLTAVGDVGTFEQALQNPRWRRMLAIAVAMIRRVLPAQDPRGMRIELEGHWDQQPRRLVDVVRRAIEIHRASQQNGGGRGGQYVVVGGRKRYLR